MRILNVLLWGLIFVWPVSSFAQTSLSESRRTSVETWIYKLSKRDLRRIYFDGKKVNESMLHTLIATYGQQDAIPALPRGNYMLVKAVGNQIEYTDYTVDNFRFQTVHTEQVMLHLYDTLGSRIEDAVVRMGSRMLRYDPQTQTYNIPRINGDKILEVSNQGVYHYIDMEQERISVYSRRHFEPAWKRIMRGIASFFVPQKRMRESSGFMVFSKPKYKPGETVRFKAYMTNRRGKPYNKMVDVVFSSDQDTTLTTLKPYRPGFFEWEFDLSDSLKLTLDTYCGVTLQTKSKPNSRLSRSFYFEAYELKQILFTAKANKERYVRSDTVKVVLRAVDENGMALYDGRVQVTVRPRNKLFDHPVYYDNKGFIPNTAWTQTFDMTGSAVKEIVIPDSIFSTSASLNYDVTCMFLNANNEDHERVVSLFYDAHERQIDFSTNKGMMTVREVADGCDLETKALLKIYGQDHEVLSEDSIQLPHALAMPWNAFAYEVRSATCSGGYTMNQYKGEYVMDYQFDRRDDSIKLIVDNPARIPFWYTLRKGKRVVKSGYSTELNCAFKADNKAAYAMQLSYIFGDQVNSLQGSLPVTTKNLTLDVETPSVVFPGQRANMRVRVANKKGKPVKDADVTAYAFTSKLSGQTPDIPVYKKTKLARLVSQSHNAIPLHRKDKSIMNWERWSRLMGLDTIEYYKFLNPKVCYTFEEPAEDNNTQIAPYVVINGVVQGVHLLWIDEKLSYFKQEHQRDVYSFPVSAGSHSLRLRTHDREVRVDSIRVEEGMMHIVSIDGEPSNHLAASGSSVQIQVDRFAPKEMGLLRNSEISELNNCMISIDNVLAIKSFPNVCPFDLPMFIHAGDRYYAFESIPRTYYYYNFNKGSYSDRASVLLAGPFPGSGASGEGKGTLYVDTLPINQFEINGGNHYRIKSIGVASRAWGKSPIPRAISPFTPELTFTERTLTPARINRDFRVTITDGLRGLEGVAVVFPKIKNKTPEQGLLQLILSKSAEQKTEKITPLLILFSCADSSNHLYYGATRHVEQFPTGHATITLIFSDSTEYSDTLTIRNDGLNYLRIDSLTTRPAGRLSHQAFNLLNKYTRNVYASVDQTDYTPKIDLVRSYADQLPDNQKITGEVQDQNGTPLIGVTVMLNRNETTSQTDLNGQFAIPCSQTSVCTFSYLGYKTRTKRLTPGHNVLIRLQEDAAQLEEAMVVAYGTQKRAAVTGSLNKEGPLYLKGNSQADDASPMILVNGIPYSGGLSDLNQADIVSIKTLKASDAMEIYGSRGVHGVILVTTRQQVNQHGELGDDIAPENALRCDFRDDAFWQPRLTTDRNGEVSFEVTYPDDITNWNTHVVAVGGRKEIDYKKLDVKSFKAVSARLSVPSFAVMGDSLRVIGKLTNYMGDTVTLKRNITVDSISDQGQLLLAKLHLDTIPVLADGDDSLRIIYSMEKDNGYFDGEQRSIPLVKQGVLETHGEFALMQGDQSRTFKLNPALGKATVFLEGSGIEVLLREIETVDSYPYMCNEQMASKVKTLLCKKQIYMMLGRQFEDDRKIKELIGKLNRNCNSEGLWGWWSRGKTDCWISIQVVEAMCEAQRAGYKTDLEKTEIINRLLVDVAHLHTDSAVIAVTKMYRSKQELLDRFRLLNLLDAKLDYTALAASIDSMMNFSLYDRLRSMEMLSSAGVIDTSRIEQLMHYAQETMLGSLHWEDKEFPRRYFGCPYGSSIENTLVAYRMLKRAGGYEDVLERIRSYFFELREKGTWRNTYESSRILETILPDVQVGSKISTVQVEVNAEPVENLPATLEVDATEIVVKKEGISPLFVSVHQQAWNAAPNAASNGFTVRSTFMERGDTVSMLHAGRPVVMELCVQVDGAAEYVMIEVPIPAGCSYHSKNQSYSRLEIHREYFPEKVSIFCNYLAKGEHRFVVNLMPRYTGRYHLNPASVSLMYFPTLYGRENPKVTNIK